MRKIMAFILAAILFLDVVSLGVILFAKAEETSDENLTTDLEDDEIFERAKVVIAGNNFIQTKIIDQANSRETRDNYKFDYLYENIADYVNAADSAVITQEGLISSTHGVSGEGFLNAPEQLGDDLIKAGFNVVDLATNHSLDYGEQGFINTLNYWNTKSDVITVGAYRDKSESQRVAIQRVNGVSIAYIAFTESVNGNHKLPDDSEAELAMAEHESWLSESLSYANKKADVVVVLAHWGNEYETEPTDAQKVLAEKMAEWGADIIVGTHPHMVQPVEYIENDSKEKPRTLVVWSLGNFVSAQEKPEYVLGGLLTFDIVKNPDPYRVTLENIEIKGVVTHYGMNQSNIRVYLLDDYTDELASKHGLKETYSDFSVKYLKKLLSQVVDKQFIK